MWSEFGAQIIAPECPYERPLGCRHTFRIKTEIAKTRPNQFWHTFQTELSPEDAPEVVADLGKRIYANSLMDTWGQGKLPNSRLERTVGPFGTDVEFP